MPIKRRPVEQRIEKKTVPRDGMDCLQRNQLGKSYLHQLYESNLKNTGEVKRSELAKRFSMLDVIKQSFIEDQREKDDAWNVRRNHNRNYHKFMRAPLGRVLFIYVSGF